MLRLLRHLRRLICLHRDMKFAIHAVSGALAVIATCPKCNSAWAGKPPNKYSPAEDSETKPPEPEVKPPEPEVKPAPTLEDIITDQAYSAEIPPAFMLALAYKESKMNPDYEVEKNIDFHTSRFPNGKKDTFWGLFQVGHTKVLPDFNKRRGTKFEREDLFDPDVNSAVAADAIQRIVKAYNGYSTKHGIAELREDWMNIDYVRLVVAGWNSGWSRSGGVQKVALWLHDKGIPVTHANVFEYARRAGATKYLDITRARKKYDWQREVVERYLKALRPPEKNT